MAYNKQHFTNGQTLKAEQLNHIEEGISANAEAIQKGVVQPNFSQNDPTAPDYIKNRTHYEETTVVNEPLNITWDGNTEGLVSVNDTFFKVSDLVLTDERIKTATVTISNGNAMYIGDIWEHMVSNEMVAEDCVVLPETAAVFVRKDNIEINGFTFTQKGIYFISYNGLYIASFTTTEPVEQTKTVVHKLDKKYLPDDATPIIYVVDNSGEETVCSCSVDINTAFNSCLSAPISVKIFGEGTLSEAYALNVNIGTPGMLTVQYKYAQRKEEVSEFIEHDSEGVRIGKPN